MEEQKMNRRTRTISLLALLSCFLVPAATAVLADDDSQRYAVTVTNITRGQVLSPPVVVSHRPSISLFTPGEEAGPELAQLAEDAVSDPLLALLGTLPQVHDTNVGAGPIPPGESATVEIEVTGNFRTLSVVGMLVTTNDGFYSTSGMVRPNGRKVALNAIAWDAGSEGNTESCDHIPGPPCGNALVRVTDTAEGFIHVHAGIQGTGDLAPADFDWNNPVANVTFRKIR
jgi:hypothetical protein